MAPAWQKLDLEGGGVQSANLRLVQHLKQRKIAYFLWLLFPVGAHRIYLDDLPLALGYTGLTALAIILRLSLPGAAWALIPAAAAVLWAVYDLVWIERRVTRLNKRIRLAEYLRPGNQAPAGFRGHFTDTEETAAAPAAGAESRRVLSFAEQERLLRELTQKK